MGSCSKFFSKFRPQVHIPLIIGGVILMAGLAFLFGFIVMLLWNWLMPEIFGLTTITYWQAWGLVILSHILFKLGSGSHDHDHDEKSFKKEFKKEFEKECEKELKEKMEKDYEKKLKEEECEVKKTADSSTEQSQELLTENEKDK